VEDAMNIKCLAAVMSIAAGLLPSSAAPETLAERYVEVRTVLGFRLPLEAAQSLLPDGWRPAPLTGLSEGVNLNVVLTERVLRETADGKPIDGGRSRSIIFIVPAQQAAGPAKGPMIVLVLAPPPESVPGVYGAAIRSQIEMTRSRQFGAAGETGSEIWTAVTDDGGKLDVELSYTRATPVRQVTVSNVYAGSVGGYYRIYRTDQGVDVMRGAGKSDDRMRTVSFRGTGGRFTRIFDGREQLVSVTAVPWHMRDVLLP
jgi:hypothetical protein